MMLYICVAAVLSAFTIYSYSLIDPNITFFQSSWWVWFRDKMVWFGYYQREYSSLTYLILLLGLFILNWWSSKNNKKVSPLKLSIVVAVITIFSYPFLSHDFFNYMFDAKIFTFYHQNPYFHKALDFPSDQWIRFMHWTHRNYPYGPVYLLISFIPSFLGLGKFSLTFFLFKVMNAGFYITSVWLLNKLDKKWALLFALHPLILIEGLINGHNDMVGLGLGVISVFFILKKKMKWGRTGGFLSAGIKYINFPVFFMGSTKKYQALVFVLQFVLLGYLSWKMEIQPWYFLALFVFIPFFGNFISRLNIFFVGLLISYYPYIRFGGWDTAEKIEMKHQIILIGVILNLIYFLFLSRRKFFNR